MAGRGQPKKADAKPTTRSSSTTVSQDATVQYPCVVCSEECKESCVRCGLCNFWCHFKCAEIEDEKVQQYVKNKKLHWFCVACEPHAISILDRIKVLEQNSDKFYKELKTNTKNLATSMDKKLSDQETLLKNMIENLKIDLTKQITDVSEKMKASLEAQTEATEEIRQTYADIAKDDNLMRLTDKIQSDLTNEIAKEDSFKKLSTRIQADITKNLSKSIDDKVEALKITLPSEPTNAIPIPASTGGTQAALNELREAREELERIDRKKLNLIFSNVTEASTINSDEEKIGVIIKEKLKITDDIKITGVARLGRRDPDKIRLLKVTFESLHHKKTVLRHATEMRKLDDDDIYSEVYIRPDLTKTQIQQSKNLSAQLKEKRDQDPGRWVIKRGRIINLDDMPDPANHA